MKECGWKIYVHQHFFFSPNNNRLSPKSIVNLGEMEGLLGERISPVRQSIHQSIISYSLHGQKGAILKLSRYERETIINFNAEEPTATLYTRDPTVMRKLDQLVISFPEVYKCIGVTDIDKTYEMPKSAVNYRKPRRLSAEQRQAASERANNLHNKGDKSVS